MRIAVTTPTGNVGRHVVAMLVRAGVRPLVLARDPSRLDPQLRDLVEATAVDQRDAASVVAATAGVDALYWVDPTTDGPDPLADYALATEADPSRHREPHPPHGIPEQRGRRAAARRR